VNRNNKNIIILIINFNHFSKDVKRVEEKLLNSKRSLKGKVIKTVNIRDNKVKLYISAIRAE
jgi:hypothetical protein